MVEECNYLIDGFPRNIENFQIWEDMISGVDVK
jgi:hypothetical protein